MIATIVFNPAPSISFLIPHFFNPKAFYDQCGRGEWLMRKWLLKQGLLLDLA
jgi:hypothetical protein